MARVRKPPACEECLWSVPAMKCKCPTASQFGYWPKATRHCTGYKDQPIAIDAIMVMRKQTSVEAFVVNFDNKSKQIISCRPLEHVLRHSPDGFEYGYGGSGPADLALSIATEIIGREAAEECYQALCDRFVAPMPRHTKKWLLPYAHIQVWHQEFIRSKLRPQKAIEQTG